MAVSIEKKLKIIEDDLLTLKATYMISGGAMKLYESVSPTFLYDDIVEGKIRFTVNYPTGEDLIVASLTYIAVNKNGVSYDFSQYAYIEPQTDANYIDIRIPVLPGSVQVSVVTVVPGTFTRIA